MKSEQSLIGDQEFLDLSEKSLVESLGIKSKIVKEGQKLLRKQTSIERYTQNGGRVFYSNIFAEEIEHFILLCQQEILGIKTPKKVIQFSKNESTGLLKRTSIFLVNKQSDALLNYDFESGLKNLIKDAPKSDDIKKDLQEKKDELVDFI